MKKQYRILLLILVIIVLLSLISSLIVKTTWFRISDDDISYIGLVAPLSGMEKGIGRSMEMGISLYLDELNHSKRFQNRVFKLVSLDIEEKQDGALNAARQLSQRDDLLGIIGGMDAQSIESAATLFGNSDLSMINAVSLQAGIATSHDWLFSSPIDTRRQAGFIANYIRNVLGKKIITIVHADTPKGQQMAEAFTTIYARFGTKIHYIHEFSQNDIKASIESVVDEIKEKKDLGTIFFAGEASAAARFVFHARDAGIRNVIAGTDVLATSGFMEALEGLIDTPDDLPAFTDNMLVSVPMLYDTSGGDAQQFKNRFMEKYGVAPDWVAAYAHDAAKMIIRGIISQSRDKFEYVLSQCRRDLRTYLKSLKGISSSMPGVTGENFFPSDQTRELRPVQVGIYNGANVIAAPIQLQPIKPERSINYFDELKSGRMLYVNDRFMYKTSVIYSGVELHGISELDMDNFRATLDFSIWFRYQGKFDPADIDFLNAVDPIVLGEPVEKKETREISFARYRIKAPFKFNFLDMKLPYGKHLMGISFHHKKLNRNNVIYVVDLLGMALDKGSTLKQQLEARRVLPSSTGWRIDGAWLSQRMLTTSTLGSPTYVGYGTADPTFSCIDYGAVISEDRIDFRSLVDDEYLIYIGIFGLIGSLAAILVDRRLSGFFWKTSSWMIRLAFWPPLLLSLGNLLVNAAIKNDISLIYIQRLIMGYDMAWWLMGATLLVIAMERFVWVPLENRTKRKVPNLIRHFTAGMIYTFAFCGIIAFVLHQTLTSVLATSGLFAMIVGLAVQGNIANVFSGIIINLERPFSVGDWIKIDTIDSVNVVDMTWRTVRLQTLTQHVVSIPNGRVADSVVVNYSKNETLRIDVFIHISPSHKPARINALIKEAIADVEGIDAVKPPVNTIMGIKPVVNKWVAEYVVRFWVTDWKQQFGIRGKIWNAVWERLTREGISFKVIDEPQNDSPLLPHQTSAPSSGSSGGAKVEGVAVTQSDQEQIATDQMHQGGKEVS